MSMTRDRKVFAAVLVFSLLCVPGVNFFHTQVWAQPVNGLEIVLFPDRAGVGDSQFKLSFRNVGRNELKLAMGFQLGNGVRYPTAVVFTVTDAQGRSWRMKDVGPPGVAGTIGPYFEVLRSGSTFSLPVGFRQTLGVGHGLPDDSGNNCAFSLNSHLLISPRKLHFGPGVYTMRAEFDGINTSDLGFGTNQQYRDCCWQGKAVSNEWTVEVPSFR